MKRMMWVFTHLQKKPLRKNRILTSATVIFPQKGQLCFISPYMGFRLFSKCQERNKKKRDLHDFCFFFFFFFKKKKNLIFLLNE
jgi:hypothetical protein